MLRFFGGMGKFKNEPIRTPDAIELRFKHRLLGIPQLNAVPAYLSGLSKRSICLGRIRRCRQAGERLRKPVGRQRGRRFRSVSFLTAADLRARRQPRLLTRARIGEKFSRRFGWSGA